jgi:SH3-like domain-containing protein
MPDKYSMMGERARAEGKSPVFVGSKPYLAWVAVRGADGMPGFVDRAFINGKPREIVWMPWVFPRK